MKVTKKEFIENKEFYFNEIKKGKIFVYPTDTVYGIGCDASKPKGIERIRKIKKRYDKPFSIIVPNKKWITDNCYVRERDLVFLNKLPGKYTLIFKVKNYSGFSREELISDKENVGVRIPDNWFAKFLGEKNVLFVTTSVNLSGKAPATRLKYLDEGIPGEVDFVIDDGDLGNTPSKVIDLSGEEIKIIR
ncbi:MAG: threonylcarbamoyl-AMP synthase [Nanoarchaeota archaeon]|nr:threonylcarbamoyl-AMP synthase [Nanoarchaeota archaeon]